MCAQCIGCRCIWYASLACVWCHSAAVALLDQESGERLPGHIEKLVVELSPGCANLSFRRLNGGFTGDVVILVKSSSIEPAVVKISTKVRLLGEVEKHREMRRHLNTCVPALLADTVQSPVSDADGNEYIGYKQSFTGACWQMPELSSAGAELATGFDALCRQSLQDGLKGCLSSVTVIGLLQNVADHLLQLNQSSAIRGDRMAPLLDRIMGHKSLNFLRMLGNEAGPCVEKLLAILDKPRSEVLETRPLRTTSHGDLHGGNLMIDSRKNTWLIDCGMVKVAPDGFPLMDITKLECCILFAYMPAPLRLQDVRDAEPRDLREWLQLPDSGSATILRDEARSSSTLDDLRAKLQIHPVLLKIVQRHLRDPPDCDAWLLTATTTTLPLFTKQSLCASMRKAGSPRKNHSKLVHKDCLLQGINIAVQYAQAARTHVHKLCSVRAADPQASHDTSPLNLALEFLFYSLRFGCDNSYHTASPWHKRLARGIACELVHTIVQLHHEFEHLPDATSTPPASSARDAPAYVTFSANQPMEIWQQGATACAFTTASGRVRDGAGGDVSIKEFLQLQLPKPAPNHLCTPGQPVVLDGKTWVICEPAAPPNVFKLWDRQSGETITHALSHGNLPESDVGLTFVHEAVPADLLFQDQNGVWQPLIDGAVPEVGSMVRSIMSRKPIDVIGDAKTPAALQQSDSEQDDGNQHPDTTHDQPKTIPIDGWLTAVAEGHCTISVSRFCEGQYLTVTMVSGESLRGTLLHGGQGLSLRLPEGREVPLYEASISKLHVKSVIPACVFGYRAGQQVLTRRPGTNMWSKGELHPADNALPNAFLCNGEPAVLTGFNHAAFILDGLNPADEFRSYQELMRMQHSSIVDVLSAQRLDLMLQVWHAFERLPAEWVLVWHTPNWSAHAHAPNCSLTSVRSASICE